MPLLLTATGRIHRRTGAGGSQVLEPSSEGVDGEQRRLWLLRARAAAALADPEVRQEGARFELN